MTSCPDVSRAKAFGGIYPWKIPSSAPAQPANIGGQNEGDELVGVHVVAERGGALRVLADRGKHSADRRLDDETSKDETKKEKSRHQLVARPSAAEIVSDAVNWILGAGTPGNPFSPPVHRASGEFSKK